MTTDTIPTHGSAGDRPQEERSPKESVPRRTRDPFFDNAKILLVILVVIGHNWYPIIGHSRAVKAAYMVVYSFHMPAFILLSGYFSRNFQARPDQVRKLVKTVLVPYLIFQVFYLVVVAVTDGTHITVDLTYPSYLCWFLVALFMWRLTTPLWRAVPAPLLVAVVISVCAGLMNVSTDMALSRILMFLPWFVAGLVIKPEHLMWLRRTAVRVWAGAVVVVSLPVAYLLAPRANVSWLDMERSASYLHVGTLDYIGIRFVLLVASAVMVAAVLALVPGRRLWFTALGAVTMYPYLLHGLVVKAAERIGVHRAVVTHGPLAVVTLTVGAVALALLLTTPPVRMAARWAVEPSFAVPRRMLRRLDHR